MSNKIAILTGPYSGLGINLAKQLNKSTDQLYLLGRDSSRHKSGTGANYPIEWDMRKPEELDLGPLAFCITSDSKILIFLNASIIEPLKKIGDFTTNEIVENISINVISNIKLINDVIGLQKNQRFPLSIVFLTSGASKKNIAGWSLYSMSKQIMETFLFKINLEHTDIRTMILDPGLVNTNMQAVIAASSKFSLNVVSPRQLRESDEVASEILAKCQVELSGFFQD